MQLTIIPKIQAKLTTMIETLKINTKLISITMHLTPISRKLIMADQMTLAKAEPKDKRQTDNMNQRANLIAKKAIVC